MPIIQGYEDAGDFTVTERLKTSVHANLVFHLSVGSIALCGLILLVILGTSWFVYLVTQFLVFMYEWLCDCVLRLKPIFSNI